MSSTTASAPARPRGTAALVALGLGAFVIGTAELVIVGVLNLIAKDTKVAVSTAGLLVTAYALGIAIGGPLVTAATIRLGRRFVLRAALLVYIAGNLLAVVATSFGLLVVARVVTGSIHGLFIGVASAVAAALVAPERRGQAIALVFGGLAVSTVLGVPLGTLVGQSLGWRATFTGIVLLGAVALVFTFVAVPEVQGSGSGGLGAQSRAAFAPRVLAMLLVGLVVIGGYFTAYTYVATFLDRVTGIHGDLVSVFLLAFGVASAVGTIVGGKLADRNATLTLVACNVILVLAMGVLYLFGGSWIVAVLALAAWGLAAFGLIPSFQLRVIGLAGPGGDLAATLGASAVNAGIALGALVGGQVLAGGNVKNTVLVAIVICAVAIPASAATRWLSTPSAPTAEPDPVPAEGPVVNAT